MRPTCEPVTPWPASPWPWRRRHALCLLGMMAGTTALATPEPVPVLRPYLGVAVAHDDNLLGLADGSPAGSDSRRRDAGLLYDQRISQQLFSAALQTSHISYDDLPQLDNNPKDLRANWNWHIGNHLDGNLGASYVQALAPFVNFHGRARNIRAQRREVLDGGWLFHPSWRLRAGLSTDRLTYELLSEQVGNRREKVAELGLDYLAASGSTIGTQLRHTRGDFPRPQQISALAVDNSYDQDEVKARINWLLTGKTQLLFLGGLVQRRHDQFPVRDYRGVNARLNANWQASVKMGFSFATWREIGALDDVTASYTLNQGAGASATWNATDKLRLDTQLKRETSDYSGTAAIPAAFSDRKDTVRSASLKLVWQASRHLRFTAQAYRNERSSTLAGNSYPATGILVGSRYEF
jgi:exopolysaccharide biosynthesis operon protein EpsL